MSKLELRRRQVGPWPMNSYALICPESSESVLIDPGADPEALKDMLTGSSPQAILLTHSHPDHIMALSVMRESLQVPVCAFSDLQNLGPDYSVDRLLKDGEVVDVGSFELQVYYSPGHIGDQICFYLLEDQRAIVGDTIFEGGPGKTWSSEGFQQTLKTLANVVLTWPDKTVCYPGHGSSFVLGDIREQIIHFLEKDHGPFFGDATWDM